MAETPDVDTTTPSIARVYDAALGGKDHFEVDRAVLAKLIEQVPETAEIVRENRAWQQRVLRWLVTVVGVDQYLDIGSGLPTRENTHEVVQALDPDCRVVYVDNDPAVAAFGRALLENDDRTRFLSADLTDPAALLADPAVGGHLDLSRPVAMMQGATLHFVKDDEQARAVMTAYVDALAPGSYVAVSHAYQPPADHPLAATAAAFREQYAEVSSNLRSRDDEQILALLPGLEPVPPGVVPVADWWPDGPRLRPASPGVVLLAGVVARKPSPASRSRKP